MTMRRIRGILGMACAVAFIAACWLIDWRVGVASFALLALLESRSIL